MLDLIISIFSRIIREYRIRRFLRTQVKMLVTPLTGEPKEVSGKELIKYADLAEKQALLRQIYGIASGGGSCVVNFCPSGFAVVEPKRLDS